MHITLPDYLEKLAVVVVDPASKVNGWWTRTEPIWTSDHFGCALIGLEHHPGRSSFPVARFIRFEVREWASNACPIECGQSQRSHTLVHINTHKLKQSVHFVHSSQSERELGPRRLVLGAMRGNGKLFATKPIATVHSLYVCLNPQKRMGKTIKTN